MTSSDLRKSLICNVIGTVLGWAGFVIGITAVSSHFWIRTGETRSGLWNRCIRDTTTCVALENVEPWLDAVRAFMIIYVIFMFCGNLASIVSHWKRSKNVRMGSGGVWSIAATFGLIGISVYTSFINQTNPAGTIEYGYGFGAAWGIVGAGYLAGLFNYISSRYLPDCQE